jgi:hypothetical protein
MPSRIDKAAEFVGGVVGTIDTATAPARSKLRESLGEAANAIEASKGVKRVENEARPLARKSARKAQKLKKMGMQQTAAVKRRASGAKKTAAKQAAVAKRRTAAKRKATGATKAAKKRTTAAKRKATGATKAAKKRTTAVKRKATGAKKAAKKRTAPRS